MHAPRWPLPPLPKGPLRHRFPSGWARTGRPPQRRLPRQRLPPRTATGPRPTPLRRARVAPAPGSTPARQIAGLPCPDPRRRTPPDAPTRPSTRRWSGPRTRNRSPRCAVQTCASSPSRSVDAYGDIPQPDLQVTGIRNVVDLLGAHPQPQRVGRPDVVGVVGEQPGPLHQVRFIAA